MKWPKDMVIVRHARSQYNDSKDLKDTDERYKAFTSAFERDHRAPETVKLAHEIWQKYRLNVSDHDTPLVSKGWEQARLLGRDILSRFPKPDVIFVSPYLRTRETFEGMRQGGVDPGEAKIVIEDRIREREHGLSGLYNDWRVFQTMHPEQKDLRELMGPYWYQYPQGESILTVRDRIRSFTDTLVREYNGAVVWLITHHLTKLAIRANYERLSPEQFIHLDEHDKPVNCGVTHYVCNPELGKAGRLELACYNHRFAA